MTHGDKAKAKKAASQASGSKKTSKAVQTGKSVQAAKTGAQSGKTSSEKGGKAVEARSKAAETGKKQQARPEKSVPAAKTSASKAGSGKEADAGSRLKARGLPPDPSGFSNPVIGNAFKRAIKKFPNAFRRLTD
jgi:hypothetical protein